MIDSHSTIRSSSARLRFANLRPLQNRRSLILLATGRCQYTIALKIANCVTATRTHTLRQNRNLRHPQNRKSFILPSTGRCHYTITLKIANCVTAPNYIVSAAQNRQLPGNGRSPEPQTASPPVRARLFAGYTT